MATLSSTAQEFQLTIDHLMWSAPDLSLGANAFRALTGISPRPGGSHSGRGTMNALVSFEHGQYLEILAPDPAQRIDNAQLQRLRGFQEPRLETFCCRGEPLEDIGRRADQLGLAHSGPLAYERLRPDGVLLRWQLLFLGQHDYPGLVPFFIDWADSPHPATEQTETIELVEITALTPEPQGLQDLYRALGIPARVETATTAGLEAQMRLPGRTFKLS